MADLISLSQMTKGDAATIKDYPKVGSAFIRLREMGLLPGTKITLVRVAPMGDPLESEADHVSVEPLLKT